MKLRNLGIYALPDGREFVVDALERGGYSLCSPETWDFNRLVHFRVGPDGQLLKRGEPTNWRVEHLIDTGRRAEYPRPSRPL